MSDLIVINKCDGDNNIEESIKKNKMNLNLHCNCFLIKFQIGNQKY